MGRARPLGNVLVWIALVACAGLVGTIGYMVIEGWSFLDSLYMSIITLATVGFREVHPLGVGGQIWTMVLSVAAVGIIFGTVGIVADTIFAQVATGTREIRRMQKRVDALRGHYIVCGYGRVGSLVARELQTDGFAVVVLDLNEDSRGRATADGFPVVPGDGTSDDVLRAAGVERARGLVSAIDSDADNVYVTLTARALNPELFIVGRAGSVEVMSKLRQAGADRAVSPYVMAGRRIVELSLRPAVTDFIDAALSRGSLEFALEELHVAAGSPLAGETVAGLRARGVFVLAIQLGPGRYEPNPADARVLAPGDGLIVSGSTEALRGVEGRA